MALQQIVSDIRKEVNEITKSVKLVAEVHSIRQEVEAIRRSAGIVKEVVAIRKEVEDIRRQKDEIVKNHSKPAAQPAKAAEPAPAPAAQPAAQPAKASEPAKPAPVAEPAVQPAKAPEPAKPAPAAQPAAQPAKAPEPAKPAPAQPAPEPAPVAQPAAQPAKAPEPAKPAPAQPAPEPAPAAQRPPAIPAPAKPAPAQPAPAQPGPIPKQQQWGRGNLLSNTCKEYYDLVRNDKGGINWVLLSYETNTQIKVSAAGSGGISELIPHLSPNDSAFAYVKVITGDQESRRSKFILVTWCGDRSPIMRKAKMSVHKSEVKQVFNSFSIEVQTSDVGDLAEPTLVAAVNRAGGANYNGQRS